MEKDRGLVVAQSTSLSSQVQARLQGLSRRPLTSKHLVFPQPAEAEVRPQLSVLLGSFTSVWWLQKVWKPQPPPGGGAVPPPGGALRPRV
jgi:hypothetical protein